MIRWWNAGRYERECADFIAQQVMRSPGLTAVIGADGIEFVVRLHPSSERRVIGVR